MWDSLPTILNLKYDPLKFNSLANLVELGLVVN